MTGIKGIKFTNLKGLDKRIRDPKINIDEVEGKNKKIKNITSKSKLPTANMSSYYSPKKTQNLLSRIISTSSKRILKYLNIKSINKDDKKNSISNKKLSKIYSSGLKTKNKTEAYKALTTFINTISEEYSTEQPPTAEEKKALYNAYIEISGKYLALLGLKKEKKISTKLKFADVIQIVDQNRRSLVENIQDKEFISAVLTGLSDPKVIASSFVYEDCLGIYFKPDPNLQLNELYKVQAKLESKNVKNKDELLKQNNKSIDDVLNTLKYVESRGLVTQRSLIRDIMNTTNTKSEEVLTKKIIKHIKDGDLKRLDVDYITDTIMLEYEKDLQIDNKKTDSSKNYDLDHIRNFIKFEVIAVLGENLTETRV